MSRRVVLLLTPAGDGLDISLGGFPFEEDMDVRNVAIRQRGRLDWPAVYDRLTPLAEAKEEPEILTRLRAIERESVR